MWDNVAYGRDSTGGAWLNAGLKIQDLSGAYNLILKSGDTQTADRTLTIVTGDADQTLTLPLPKNDGKAWISHGNNVITFANAHSDANYRWTSGLTQSGMGSISPRNVAHTRPLSVFVSNESTTRGKVRIEGGYGFTSCGVITAIVGTTQRLDDVANTHTARTAATARVWLAGYSLNGYGFTSCGYTTASTGTTERFDDVANTQTARTAATARRGLAGYATNEYFINYTTFND